MTDISPLIMLQIANDRDAYGWMQSPPDFLAWDLRGYLNAQSAYFSGLSLDPTGQYVMQTPVPVMIDADETQWGSLTGTYTHGTDAGSGKKYLRQTNPSGSFSATHSYARAAEEGLSVGLFLNQASAPTTYLAFNTTLRLAFEPNTNIRLQFFNGTAWVDTGVEASGLGECEGYLTSVGRKVLIDVLPQTDPSWYAGLPNTAQYSGAPPGQIVVSINGSDAVMALPASSLPGGSLVISGTGRGFSASYAKKRFAPTATASLPVLSRPRAFVTAPSPRAGGYVPLGSGSPIATVTLTQTDVNQASASLAVNASAYVDATTYSTASCYLTTAEADFPSLEQPPSAAPDWVTYVNPCYRAKLTWEHDPQTNTTRGRAVVRLDNNDRSLTPDNVHLGVRAARLFFSVDGGNTWVPVLTGFTGLAQPEGLTWGWENSQPYFEVVITDMLSRAETAAVGYLPPFDRGCHYWAMGLVLRRQGLTGDALDFPVVNRSDVTPYFYFPGGTNADPAFQIHPSTTLLEAREMIRAKSAELDYSTGTPLPMVLTQDALGTVYYAPLPVGVVNCFLQPGQSVTLPQTIVYNGIPTPGLLNELRGARTWMDLSVVRSPVVYEGLDAQTGDAVVGFAYNELIGGGYYSDPDEPGYVGVDMPMIDIDRLVSSVGYAELLSAAAYAQLSFPAIGADLTVPLQPGLMPLNVIGLQNYELTGSADPVPFYVTGVESEIILTPGGPAHEQTRISARLLGQA